MSREIVIGTRDSALALWQTRWVLDQLQKHHPEHTFKVVEMKTQGDKILDVALAKIGDKGLFTKELEVAMLNRDIDLAVHSMKDLPTRLPEGLTIGAICVREEPGDVLIGRTAHSIDELPQGAKVGTSSLRRRAQLKKYRPDLQIEDLRGNLNTRMRKLEDQGFDAIVLAAAGVIRLGWSEKISQRIPFDISLPAVGQGSVGIEIRQGDEEILKLVKVLEDPAAAMAITAERAMLRTLEGGCQIPIGAFGRIEDGKLVLDGLVASLDGETILRTQVVGNPGDAEALGLEAAQNLLDQGAMEVLKTLRQETGANE